MLRRLLGVPPLTHPLRDPPIISTLRVLSYGICFLYSSWQKRGIEHFVHVGFMILGLAYSCVMIRLQTGRRFVMNTQVFDRHWWF